ncbi:ATP-binding protein [Pseudoduganella danionis]|uniref:ATP-binding protein n=1 Tax=Pseudoduganella danionis TaxID=1890295 RepID=A0ABW9SQH2_9BURK|nr:ATP-binding protein [Pseudoduganella danionis]MTW34095.1 ATP-binding protein [Pseudoduganella danionis]
MTALATSAATETASDPALALAELWPAAPRSVREAGLPAALIAELIAKAILQSGKTPLSQLSTRMHLSLNVLREVLDLLVAEHVLEVAWRGDSDLDVQYQLTATGRQRATAWLERCAYVGPAPVPLAAYAALVERQAAQMLSLSAEDLAHELGDVFLATAQQRMLGAALYAGRTVLLHGPSGSGKSTLARRLGSLLQGVVAVPHALLIGSDIVQVYDAMLHRAPQPYQLRQLGERRSCDPRWVLCQRPVLTLDAELTSAQLELQADTQAGCYRAPPQLQANNGLLIVDDLGRQHMPASDLLNRLTLAQELGRSSLSMGAASAVAVACRLQLVFVTSMQPASLFDASALRRLSYKIGIDALDAASYRTLFRHRCVHSGVVFDDVALRYLIEQLHGGSGLPLLACYPAEIVGRIRDFAGFLGEAPRVTVATLDQAWISMFAADPALPATAGAAPVSQRAI